MPHRRGRPDPSPSRAGRRRPPAASGPVSSRSCRGPVILSAAPLHRACADGVSLAGGMTKERPVTPSRVMTVSGSVAPPHRRLLHRAGAGSGVPPLRPGRPGSRWNCSASVRGASRSRGRAAHPRPQPFDAASPRAGALLGMGLLRHRHDSRRTDRRRGLQTPVTTLGSTLRQGTSARPCCGSTLPINDHALSIAGSLLIMTGRDVGPNRSFGASRSGVGQGWAGSRC